MLDVPLDFDVFKPFPDFMLGAAFVVYGDQANLMEAALNCTEFFRNESCGKCVPCRMGSQKTVDVLAELLKRPEPSNNGELEIVGDLSDMMLEAAICGLGWVVSSPIRSLIKHFPHIVQKYAKLPPAKAAHAHSH
jgi:NADH:ubiquinone oxidoreductase subunit F (NADH-binding)